MIQIASHNYYAPDLEFPRKIGIPREHMTVSLTVSAIPLLCSNVGCMCVAVYLLLL